MILTLTPPMKISCTYHTSRLDPYTHIVEIPAIDGSEI